MPLLLERRAERFRDSFFRRETRGQMARWKFHRHRIFNLAISKNSLEEMIAKSIDRPLDAGALDKVDTGTNHAHFKRIVMRLCETPTFGV
jgi:hypothetical protein